jgi:hypothetical protein
MCSLSAGRWDAGYKKEREEATHRLVEESGDDEVGGMRLRGR